MVGFSWKVSRESAGVTDVQGHRQKRVDVNYLKVLHNYSVCRLTSPSPVHDDLCFALCGVLHMAKWNKYG